MRKAKRMLSCALAAALMTAVAPGPGAAVRAEETGERSFQVKDVEEAGKWIQDIYTDKSMYQPGSSGVVTVELKEAGANGMGLSQMKLTLQLRHLGDLVMTREVSLAGGSQAVSIPLVMPGTDFTGYSLEVYLWGGGRAGGLWDVRGGCFLRLECVSTVRLYHQAGQPDRWGDQCRPGSAEKASY